MGDHFHFTAFGIDWIKKRCIEGNPPTYGEFTLFWQKEHTARKQRKSSSKQERAYITFLQNHVKKYPNAS